MSERIDPRASTERVRQHCHRIVDRIARLKENRLEAAEQALRQAPNDAVRQTLVETSMPAEDEVTAAFVQAAVRVGSVQLARAAADLLLDIKDPPSARAAIAEAMRSDDSSVRRRAVEALETLRDPSALDLLTEALHSEDESVRRAVTNTLGLVLGSKYHPLKDMVLERFEDPHSDLHRTIAGSSDVNLRREVAQVLGFADSDRVLPVLQVLSKDPDYQTRREVALALAGQKGEGARRILQEMLQDADDVVVASVLDILATRLGRDSPQLLECVRQALRHPLSAVRRHAVLMLDQFKPADARDAIEQAARDEDFEVQRSARSLLRRYRAEVGARPDQYGDEDQTLMIWEAGNIGVEGAGSLAAGATAEDVVPLLERAASTGSPAGRVQAIGELEQLRDIADSPALQQALYDADDAVRSRAATGLSHTRDAGLLADVLARHPDLLLRRQALEALAQNPSGRRGDRPGHQEVTFASTRTVGMELFSFFLAALEDPDEGVREQSCAAISRYIEAHSPMPVPRVRERLEAVVRDESLSSLVRDRAQELLEKLADAALAEPLVRLTDSVLEWRGRLARDAHALRHDPGSGRFTLDASRGLSHEELAQRWTDELGLAPAHSEAAAKALRSGEPLPAEVAAAATGALVRGLVRALNGVYHACHAVRLIGEERWQPDLERWARAMAGGPALDWGDTRRTRAWKVLLPRMRARAFVAAVAAARALRQPADYSVLDEVCAHEDDWVRMMALAERSALQQDAGKMVEELAALCRAHTGDPEFMDPAGRAAVALVGAQRAEFVDAAEAALEQAQTDLRFELTQKLMIAAQQGAVAGAVRSRLEREPVCRLGQACLALALRGAGGDLAGLEIPAPPEDSGIELVCAHRALRAMQEDEEAAEALKASLRGRGERERYCAAVYLGIARVHSASPVFASVSDQDAPWALRSLCGGMLVRRGHPQGVGWFAKNVTHASGMQKARMASDLGRAVEDVIALMTECKDVNLGRFV